MHAVNMASGCTHEETSFLSLDDLENICILLDEDYDLEEEIYLMSKFILSSSLKKSTTNQALNIMGTCTVIRGNFERIQVCFLV